jgi:hypothetical protein
VFNRVQRLSSLGPQGLLQEEDMSGLLVLKAHKVNKMLPPGYRVDHDPDVAVLRRPDGSVVGYFPIWSMNPERILREAELDLASAHLANS